jgi:hypothetical protein
MDDSSNEMYQKELLTVFGLTTYSDTLMNSIQQLYISLDYPMKEIVQHVPFQYSDDPELLFLVLFSYDYFKYTHALICNIINKQDTKQSHDELISALKK